MDAALEAALRTFAARPTVLVALDFDGTLAPIVSRRLARRASARRRRSSWTTPSAPCSPR
jgi:trehalose-6-phosphatase